MNANVEVPLLRRTAKVSHRQDQIVIEHLMNEVVLDGAAAELFGRMLPFLNGKTEIASIAEKLGERPGRVRALAAELDQAGVLAAGAPGPGGGSELMTGAEFHALHQKHCEALLRPVYEHPLWDRIVSGKASRAQVIGFAFEKYHYIEGAYEHMGIAAANATPEMMPHLARHFIEEYTHGDIYRKGLRSLFADDIVVRSQPLPSTRALINFLSESAARNSFGYYAGNDLLQMTENTPDSSGEGAADPVESFYDAMRRHYPYTAPLIESFIAHTRADQRLGHVDVFKQMCASVPPMSRREVRDAMNIVRSMAEHLVLFMDGIDRFYENVPVVPRVPCTLLSE